MKRSELINKMNEFAERVLWGSENTTAQETAILPKVLEMLLKEKPSDETNVKYEIEYCVDEHVKAQRLSQEIIKMCAEKDITLRELAILEMTFPGVASKTIENNMRKQKLVNEEQ